MELTPVAANASTRPAAASTPPAGKLNKFTKYNIMRELRTGTDRNHRNGRPLSQKIVAHLTRLKAHFAATDGQCIEDVLDELHPTVQSVYHLLQSQTTTIVAAINGRADLTDAKLDRQQRILTGQSSIEDRSGLTRLDLLAQNCQAVRALQSQNIQIRAEGVAEQKAQKLEEIAQKKAQKEAQKKAIKVRKTAVKPTTERPLSFILVRC